MSGQLNISKNNNNYSEYLYLLKKISLLSIFSDDDLCDLLRHSRVRNYNKKSTLLLVGDKSDYFYIVIEGCIKLARETTGGAESIIALIAKNETFGCVVSLVGAASSYSAEAIDDSIILEIPTDYVRNIADRNGVLEQFLIQVISEKLNHINELGLQAEHRVMMTSSQRVGCFLLRMCREHSANKVSFKLPYDKNIIASKIGMAPETLSRALSGLVEFGVISQGANIVISDVKKLQMQICLSCSALENECSMIARLNLQ